MRAWLMDDYGGVDQLRMAEVPDPSPGPGEVVLQILFAGLNPADRYLAEKQYPVRPAFPHVLGRDGIGTVVQLGPGVERALLGSKRAILRGDAGGSRWGTFAEKVAVKADYLVEIPADWTDEEGAGATLVYLTAYQALTMWGPLAHDAVVLVTGASGGVGVASIQLAAAMGHTVVALSRSAEKSQRLRELGAAFTFDPASPQWRQQARAALGERRVDLVVDNIGGRLLPQVIETLGEQGKASLVGRLAGPIPEFNTATLFFRRLRLGGVAVGAYTNREAVEAWQAVLLLLGRSGGRPLVDSVHPFEGLKQAFARLAEGPLGKVLLHVGARAVSSA